MKEGPALRSPIWSADLGRTLRAERAARPTRYRTDWCTVERRPARVSVVTGRLRRLFPSARARKRSLVDVAVDRPVRALDFAATRTHVDALDGR